MTNQKPDQPTCDVCGKPATTGAVDILEEPNYDTGVMAYQPIGPKKYGCDEHPAVSETHQSAGNIRPIPGS